MLWAQILNFQIIEGREALLVDDLNFHCENFCFELIWPRHLLKSSLNFIENKKLESTSKIDIYCELFPFILSNYSRQS